MRSLVTNKNVSWFRLIWPTLYGEVSSARLSLPFSLYQTCW